MECCDTETAAAPRHETPGAEGAADRATQWRWFRIGVAALLGGNAMVVGLSINLSSLAPNLRLFIEIALLGSTALVFELVGRPLARNAAEAIRDGELSFEFLFLAGILGSVGASVVSMFRGSGPVYFEVASLLMAVYAAGDTVGRISRARGMEAARSLGIDVETCRVRTDCGHTREVPLEEISVGDRVVVRPGETVPVDGAVTDGEGFVRDAHVTGEWASTVKRPGDRVYGGSDVVDRELVVETRAAPGERMVDSIRASVEAAWNRPSDWEREADRIVQWFFPAVVGLTAATFAYWFWAASWDVALFHSLAVLLIACPCALGFAVPLAVWLTLGSYAERGLVAEEGSFVERLARCDAALFDKTGTLTTGGARLVDFVANPEVGAREALRALVRTLEQGSDHPVAEAFRAADLEEDPRWRLLASYPVPGAGIRGTVRDTETGASIEVAVGTRAVVPREQTSELEELVERLHREPGHRTVAVVVDGEVAAAASVAEESAPGIDEMLESLRAAGVAPALVTGDRSERARELGFDRVYAGMQPDEKEALVRELQDRDREVLYVGDGVNDAAAMAAADVGIAKRRGSEWTVDVADATWHGEDPTQLADALDRARTSLSLIRSNLGYAVVYNAVGIGAAAAGYLHPVAAAVLMVGSSLFVTWRTVLTLEE